MSSDRTKLAFALVKKGHDLRNDIVIRAERCGAFEKNAAMNYFHQLRKVEVDREAFGERFCKFAEATNIDPWDLALQVADNFPAYAVLSKTASDPRAREVAEFYMDWAEEMEKAAFLGAIGKGLRVAKAGIGQAVKNVKGGLSSSGRMRKAVAASGSGAKIAPTRSIRGAMGREAKNVDKIRAQGGGSYGRGQKVIKQRQAEIVAKRAPKTAPQTAPQTGAPPPKPSVPQSTGVGKGKMLLGAGIIGGSAVAGTSAMAGGQPQGY